MPSISARLTLPMPTAQTFTPGTDRMIAMCTWMGVTVYVSGLMLFLTTFQQPDEALGGDCEPYTTKTVFQMPPLLPVSKTPY